MSFRDTINATWHTSRCTFNVQEEHTLTGKLGHLSEGAPWVFRILTHLYASIAFALAQNKRILTETSREFCDVVQSLCTGLYHGLAKDQARHISFNRLKRKPTSNKNPQANALLERVHQVLMGMVHTSEINMAGLVKPHDIDAVLTNASWTIRSTYHTVLKASPGAAVFGQDMLFNIIFIADWKNRRLQAMPD